ncbi:3-ketoacyl-ACP reductase [Lentzea aerocolonigenes]|uniref:3-ketoacyl-ACP reductase n=1 Tax=Lentzea aerocolonigenes TaxID=68170 RepID=A0A0F0GSV0_LENAE|nr:oxidoreductase [Lentzea aerocolonigenes]KJK44468.1 3-ketoacyl-ACP reductase [Lentzea aerocolonigenes]
MSDKVWLITGANSGFGRAIAEAAIGAGDRVVAAARRTESLDDLVRAHPNHVVPVQLDVTDHEAIRTAVANVIAEEGRIDVLVNNAGRTHVGAVEETTDEDLRSLFDVHLFGPAALIRAVLPHMRAQQKGAIVQMSSIGGQLSFAGFGAYSATKCALEGLSEALADEVKSFGIKVLIVEPGAFRTSLFENGSGSADSEVYADSAGKTRQMVEANAGKQPGDPRKAAQAVLKALDAAETPLRLPLGPDSVDGLLAHLSQVKADIERWEKVARETQLDG